MREKSAVRKIYGRRAVLEALRSKDCTVEKLILAKGTHGSMMQELKNTAEAHNVPVEWMERRRVEKMAGPVVSQGVLAMLQSHNYATLDTVLDSCQAAGSKALIIITDEIEDPRNLGAIARCAEGAGAQGMIITAHRSSEVTGVAEKASGGALNHLPVVKVINLANTIKVLKEEGLWMVGLDAQAEETVWQADLKRPIALIIGSEGKGLRRLTKEACDMLVKIPMQGQVNSLNASVASGVALFEIIRQRQPSVQGVEQ